MSVHLLMVNGTVTYCLHNFVIVIDVVIEAMGDGDIALVVFVLVNRDGLGDINSIVYQWRLLVGYTFCSVSRARRLCEFEGKVPGKAVLHSGRGRSAVAS